MNATCYTSADYLRLRWPAVFSCSPLFYAYAAHALSRRVAAEQTAWGIADEVTCATMRDIGQQVFLRHRVHGEVGMN